MASRDGSDLKPETPSSAKNSLIAAQREVNEQLVLASLRSQEESEAAQAAARDSKASEEALRLSEQQLRAFASTVPFLAWYANPDGHIAWYNQRWFEYTGTTLEEQVGWKWQSVHDQEDLSRVVAKWKAALASGEPWEDVFRLRRHDGALRWFLSRAMPLREESGRIVRWYGTSADIDDQKRAEVERARLLASEREARRDAEVANRLKDEFLATMSHELRTPLNAILGWAALLRQGNHDKKEIDRALATIERNARAQARLIEDVLDVSRIMSGKLRLDIQRVDITSIINAAIDVVRPAADAKQIDIEFRFEDEAISTCGDPDRLQQIVWNLLSNAVKFTPPHGAVEVSATRVDDRLQITVSDRGVGIAPAHLSEVFERFRQVDSSTTRRHGGLGLGLAIVRQLVELHGGVVRAESAGLGQGTTVTCFLPIGAAVADQTVPETSPGEAEIVPASCRPVARLDGLRIVVADDENDSRDVIGAALERAGATVITVSSARAALEVIERSESDLLISDIGMPDEDGYSLIRRVRRLPESRGGTTPAIALTAYARPEDAQQALAAGYHRHLPKPVDPAELTEAADKVARR